MEDLVAGALPIGGAWLLCLEDGLKAEVERLEDFLVAKADLCCSQGILQHEALSQQLA